MFKDIFKHKILQSDEIVNVIGLNKQVQASYVWNLFCVQNDSLLIVTNTLYEANSLYKSLYFYSENDIYLFPMDDFLVSEALAISPDLMAKRIEVINELTNSNTKKIIITNLTGYLRYLPTKKLWSDSSIIINKNDTFSRDELIKKLNMIGYKKETIVTKTGEYASRGYILDIFPYGYDNPLRIEFFDDEISEIREFSSESQLSINSVDKFNICPFTEFINEKQVQDIPDRQSLLPRVTNKVSKLSDYVDNLLTIYIDIDGINLAYEKILNDTIEFKETDQFKIDKYMHDLNIIKPNNYINILGTDNYIEKNNTEVYDSFQLENYNGNFKLINEFLNKLISQNKKVVVCLDNILMIEDFKDKIQLEYIITNENEIFSDKVNIIKKQLNNGFGINDYVFISSKEIYKSTKNVNYTSKFRYGSKIKDINKLKIGDFIVHSSFGVGRYLGIVTLSPKGLKKDYIHIEYKDNDKLYIPVENIEYISKYSSNEGATPKLSKLGGTDWYKQKARVKTKAKDIAKQLLETSAKRKLISGFAFLEDDEEQYRFEQNFIHKETKDQLKAIEEIKKDMELSYPMDRLLCGDVGYGKTEVAFRAIFKAIKSGKQVAFLCPTTILSKQHYENAKQRFEGFGINIEVLNRFVANTKKEEILNNLKTGKTDLIIGTHRLLSKDIIYKDLGLLVIDEEQRFGVTHKEKIKEYKENIDILTLSATPIPRTLQMSLSGLRGLSLIETPPAFRYPVQTYVLRENDQIIKDAIYKELSREGQVFVLYNNVSKIQDQVVRLKKLVPEANICFIHGQMQKNEIEKTMEAFVNKEFDILVCTTIIETGIDIENANTLIVIDADHFGLSQLYQIRGRIGRGKNIAYAYLMYQKNKELSDIAVKRLNAIKEFTELGSGYALAVRDLSIRGAGDILGAEQSGFIDSIGYDMYLKILNEQINELKGNIVVEEDEKPEIKPFLQVETHISDKYTEDDNLKIEIHKKINTIDSYEKFEMVKKELEDRFGKLDESIIIYMLEELFQVKAKEKSVIKVDQMPRQIVAYFSLYNKEDIDGADLLTKLFKITPNFTIDYSSKTKILKVILDTRNLKEHFIYYLVKMIHIIE